MNAVKRFLMGPLPFYFLGGWNAGSVVGSVVLGHYAWAVFEAILAAVLFYVGFQLASGRRAQRQAERALGHAIMASIEADAQRQKREVR